MKIKYDLDPPNCFDICNSKSRPKKRKKDDTQVHTAKKLRLKGPSKKSKIDFKTEHELKA